MIRYSVRFLVLFSVFSAHGTLVVMRHGESTHNVQERYNSNPDHPDYVPSFLTEQGCKKIEESCQQLIRKGITKETVVAAYVSPLPRTIQTAAVLILKGVLDPERLKIDKRLIEVLMGDREHKKYSDFPDNPWNFSPEVAQTYGGETHAQIRSRVTALWRETPRIDLNKYTLLITHGGPAKELLAALGQENLELQPGEFVIIE